MQAKSSLFLKAFWSFVIAPVFYVFLPGPTYVGLFLLVYLIILYKFIYGDLASALIHLYLFTLVIGKPAFSLEGVVVQDYTFFNYPVLLSIPIYIPWRFIVFIFLAILAIGIKYSDHQRVDNNTVKFTTLVSWMMLVFVCVAQFLANYITKFKFPFFQLVQVFLVFPVLGMLFTSARDSLAKASQIFYVFCIFSLVLEGATAAFQFLLKSPLNLNLETTFDIPFVTAPETGIFRSPGTLGHPNYLGVFVGMLLPIVLLTFLEVKRGYENSIIKISLAFGFMGLMFSLSRWAWLSVLIAVYIVVLLRKKQLRSFIVKTRNNFSKKNIFLAGIGVIVIAFILAFVASRLLLLGTFEGRVEVLRSAIILIKEHSIWGVGPGNSIIDLSPYRWSIAEYLNSLKGVHNTVLLLATENGLPLAALFILFIAVLFYNVTLNKKILVENRTLGFVLCAMVFVFNSLAYSLLYWDPSLELFFIAGAFIVFDLTAKDSK